jgi:hypothetical protein
MAFKPKGVKSFDVDDEAELIAALLRSKQAREMVQAMLAIGPSKTNWRGLHLLPPNSQLERAVMSFQPTDIPYEVPYFAILHYVAMMLLARKTKIVGIVGVHYPDLWTIVLADSGGGKTLAHSAIADAAPVKSTIPDCAGAAAWIAEFAENNFGSWFQDEIAQKIKNIEAPQGPLSDMKPYLLNAFSNQKIERVTKSGRISIETPALGIFGLNTPESFYKAISAESMLDGFAQRFAVVIAEADPERLAINDPAKYALYNKQALTSAAKRLFNAVSKVKLHDEYTFGVDAENAYRESFAQLIPSNPNMSYFRRSMFLAIKYALIYHVILGKETSVIDAEDIGWGARVSDLHMADSGKLLRAKKPDGSASGFSRLEEYVIKGRAVKARLEAEGKKFDARALQQNVSRLKSNAALAREVFSLI